MTCRLAFLTEFSKWRIIIMITKNYTLMVMPDKKGRSPKHVFKLNNR